MPKRLKSGFSIELPIRVRTIGHDRPTGFKDPNSWDGKSLGIATPTYP
ncbi:protein of unknown function [uncultured Woeseiaceae bacterium]|uniref:Uncharacterized protein n=1 Tax=uncultured Woeseiaceae bacterium TaxID=1983305 RepID=A0A7D9H7U1_9GAMM|nr:protein of unknown function [uncultured Woeseiaceae bacterium]